MLQFLIKVFIFDIILAHIIYCLSDIIHIKLGFFFGYNSIVWINIIVQAAGGLLVALVIKYADNILKGFATSIAIIVSCIASAYLFKTVINLVFAVGTLLVVVSVVLYSYTPPKKVETIPIEVPLVKNESDDNKV